MILNKSDWVQHWYRHLRKNIRAVKMPLQIDNLFFSCIQFRNACFFPKSPLKPLVLPYSTVKRFVYNRSCSNADSTSVLTMPQSKAPKLRPIGKIATDLLSAYSHFKNRLFFLLGSFCAIYRICCSTSADRFLIFFLCPS